MAVIYLKHPLHGSKVACSDIEVRHDKAQGWEEYDPSEPSLIEKPKKPELVPAVEPVVRALQAEPVEPVVQIEQEVPAPVAPPDWLSPPPSDSVPKKRGGRRPKVQ